MANKTIVRNAYGERAVFSGSKTGNDQAAFVFVSVGNEERRMRWAEWDALPAWTGPHPSGSLDELTTINADPTKIVPFPR